MKMKRLVGVSMAAAVFLGMTQTSFAAFGPGMELAAVQETQDAFIAETTAAAEAVNAGEVTAEEIAAFFEGSVITGDSVAAGFGNYIWKHADDPMLSRITPITEGGFSLDRALNPETEVQPPYKGDRHCPIWQQMQNMQTKHVYMFFGINDAGDKKYTDKYCKLIEKIGELSPEADFTIVSATYLAPGADGKIRKTLTTAAIKEMNAKMKELADEKGWGYINVADRLAGEDGHLDLKYCTDGELHQTDEAYDIWTEVFTEYAVGRIKAYKEAVQSAEEALETAAAEIG